MLGPAGYGPEPDLKLACCRWKAISGDIERFVEQLGKFVVK